MATFYSNTNKLPMPCGVSTLSRSSQLLLCSWLFPLRDLLSVAMSQSAVSRFPNELQRGRNSHLATGFVERQERDTQTAHVFFFGQPPTCFFSTLKFIHPSIARCALLFTYRFSFLFAFFGLHKTKASSFILASASIQTYSPCNITPPPFSLPQLRL